MGAHGRVNQVPFFLVLLSSGICTFLVICAHSRPVNIPGSVTHTRLTNFPFFGRLANPCEIQPAISNVTSTSNAGDTTQMATSNNHDFYRLMISVTERTLDKLTSLESADPSLPECNGISLDSLPATPLLDNVNEAQTIQESYKTGIYLVTHFHLMQLDRQLTVNGENNVPDNQLESDVPAWRFLRCGNESVTLPSHLESITHLLENMLCNILTSATDEQRASFRAPFNRLSNTVLYRYHNSCSMLQTRDCLVVREAKQSLTFIKRKFSMLIHGSRSSVGESETALTSQHINNDHEMDNSL